MVKEEERLKNVDKRELIKQETAGNRVILGHEAW